jgi:hypothetical protein
LLAGSFLASYETRSSLTYSQELATEPSPGTVANCFCEVHFNITLPSMPVSCRICSFLLAEYVLYVVIYVTRRPYMSSFVGLQILAHLCSVRQCNNIWLRY